MCYLLERSTVDGAKWRRLIGGLLNKAGLKPRAVIKSSTGKVINGCECVYWGKGGRTVVCVLANKIHRATVSSFSVDISGEPLQAEIEFTVPVKDLVNERTGKTLGNGKRFTFLFNPWEASVFSYK